MAPGSTVISATAISVEILNTVESAIFAVPPEYCVAFIWENANENGLGTWPWGSEGGWASSGGGAVRRHRVVSIWYLYADCVGRRLTAGKDVELLVGDMVEGRYVRLEVPGEDFLGQMSCPVRQLHCESQTSSVIVRS